MFTHNNEISAIRDKKQIFYLAGVIQYDDGFGFKETTNFAFEYIPPPNEGWTSVNGPIPLTKESLERKADSLSLGSVNIMTPSPEASPVVTPTYKPSPLANMTVTPSPLASITVTPSPFPSVTVTPHSPLGSSFKLNSKTLGCGCVCRVSCNNECQFECSGCTLAEGAAAGSCCCDQAMRRLVIQVLALSYIKIRLSDFTPYSIATN